LPCAIKDCARANTSKADSVPNREREAAVFNIAMVIPVE